MSAYLRRPARVPRPPRRGIARMPVLGLGLMVTGGIVTAAAFTVPGPVDGIASAGAEHAAAGGGKPADPGNQGTTDPGNQGNPPGQSGQVGQGGHANPNPGGDTSGQNDPGTNPAGHANGGTGTGSGTDPGTESGLGSGMLVELRVTTSGDVPPDLDASGAEFAFSDAADGTPAGTCVTGVAGTCTVLLGPELVTGGSSVLMLADGTYEVTQTEAAPGLAPVAGVIGTFSLCSCEQTLSVPVTNASLFRTSVLATVLDEGGHPVADRAFSLTGPGVDTEPATSGPDGTMSFDGFFAPGWWTFTPTTPAGFETLPSQMRELSTTPAEAASPWTLDLQGAVLVPTTVVVIEEEGTGGTGGTGGGTGDTGGTGTTGGDNGSGSPSGGDTGAGDPNTNDPGDGGEDTGVGDSGTQDPEDPEVPDSDDHGTGNPGTDHPSTGHPGTANPGHPGTNSSGSGGSGTGSTGWVADTGEVGTTSVDPEPTEEASAPTTSSGSATPSRRPADAGDPIVLAEAPQLETVGFREAGLVSSGFVLVAIVVLGFLLYRRRSRRER